MRCIICFFLLASTWVQAQQSTASSNPAVADSNIFKRVVGSEAHLRYRHEWGYGSGQLPLSYALDFLSADFLDESFKDDVLRFAENGLEAGYLNGWSLEYQLRNRRRGRYDNGKTLYAIGIDHRSISSFSATEDAIRLLLKGNKSLAGSEAILDGTELKLWNYTGLRYSFGLGSRDLPLSMGVSIILAHRFTQYKFDKARLFTQQEGRYIDLDAQYSLREFGDGRGLDITGMGLAGSWNFEQQISGSTLQLSVRDLGFVYFTSGKLAQGDTNFRYEGLDVPNLFDIKDSLIQAQGRSLERLYAFTLLEDRFELLPFFARARLNHPLEFAGFTEWYGELDYLHMPGYSVNSAIGIQYRLGRKVLLNGELGYGGFQTWKFGAGVDWAISPSWQFKLELQNLASFLFPRQLRGSLVQFQLSYALAT